MASCNRLFVKAETSGEAKNRTTIVPVTDLTNRQTVGKLKELLLEQLHIDELQPDQCELRLAKGDAVLQETNYVSEVIKNDDVIIIGKQCWCYYY